MSVTLSRRGLMLTTAALAAARPVSAVPAPKTTLAVTANFQQQVTGVAVSKEGRVFVNFPRWETDVPISVAEVMPGGQLRPYPDAEWNAWSNLKPLSLEDHFVCVQSVTVDPQGFLWVIDPAAPGNEFVKPGGVKLVKIDLRTDKVVRVYPFDAAAAPQGSYMNDVRVSPDGATAYLTDSGQRGALVVLDTASGAIRRVLDGHPSTQPEPGVVPMADGHELRRPDHRIPAFAADGIALDPAGQYLYWQALVGRTLYRIPTASLRSATMSPADAAASIEKLATTNVADGLWMDGQGYLFITDPAINGVRMRAPDGTMSVVAQDPRLRWPDSMAEGADGSIYVTASHIQDMGQFHKDGSAQKGPWQLFRILPPHPR